MRRTVYVSLGVLALVALFVAGVHMALYAKGPERLIRKLRRARGEDNRAPLVMKLGLMRGDTVPLLLEAFRDADAPRDFRRVLLDLLLKKYHRTSDSRIRQVLLEAAKDDDPQLRIHVVQGLAVFGSDEDHLELLDLMADASPDVRWQVYALLTAGNSFDHGVWRHMDEAVQAEVTALARTRVHKEQDPELKAMARSVVGRRIGAMAYKAVERLQTADVLGAEALLNEALELDPESHLARIRLVRHYLATEDRDKALATAEKFGALIRIPRLATAPDVDGDPEENAWTNAYVSDTSYMNSSRWIARPAEGKTRTCLGHHDGVLYVAVYGYEDDLDKLLVRHTARDSPVWRDDCVEIMLDPSLTEKRFYKFAINAAGALDDGYRGARRGTKQDFVCRHAAGVFRDRGYWACEFAVAAKDLDGNSIAPESLWGINVVRTRIGPASECCSIWPTYGNNLRVELFPIAVFDNAQ